MAEKLVWCVLETAIPLVPLAKGNRQGGVSVSSANYRGPLRLRHLPLPRGGRYSL